MPNDRKALGKGLSALLPGRQGSTSPLPTSDGGVRLLPIDSIEPNPVQPRSVFQSDKLNELAQSIRANGIIQPLIVQKVGDKYQLVAGERRWRASRLAGLSEVPAVVRNFATERLLEIALIENIQREDLNPIEIASALHQLSRDCNLSHEELGQRTGKDRTTVTNLLRLLKLPQAIQVLLAEHRLSMGHARALLALPDEQLQLDTAQRVVLQSLSVRQTERLVQSLTANREGGAKLDKPGTKYDPGSDPNVTAATRELEAALGTRVRITAQSPDRGRIEIDYYTFEELDRIYNQILGNGNGAGGRS